MKKLTSLVLIAAVVSAGAASCGGEGAGEAGPTETNATTTAAGGDFVPTQEVPARANIFAAGQSAPYEPAPGGGGAGVAPPVWHLPADARDVRFARVTGRITPVADFANEHGAGGGSFDLTDVRSDNGISGLVHHRKFLFLVGVFLTDSSPSDPAPKRLNFTKRDGFDLLAPEIAQTFFVGEGVGRTYRVPRGATRLFLGFVDHHCGAPPCPPSWYHNNGGALDVTVDVTTG